MVKAYNMDELIELLKKIEDDADISGSEYDVLSDNHPNVYHASSLAELLLITPEGRCDWKNIRELQSNGYAVGPLEKDSFGWLIGGIETSKGVIAYG